MANSIEYIFSLQDKVSAKIGNITVTSDRMLGKFADLEKKSLSVTRTFNETGKSMGALRERISALQAEREWIPAENIEGIRAYNREIKKLNKEVVKLESLNGGKFKQWSKDAFNSLPGSNLISNPLVAGAAAIGFTGKEAMNFDQGMAKVNITAQLDEKGLNDLRTRLKKVVKDNKADIEIAPVGLEKIISQVGDVDLSMQIFDATLKGSKAGFTDLDTVSGALAQSLSVIGKENANAKEVLDVFFAAKRVGAGEFADFARYIPGLIAGASNMGINFKQVAGTFAYMTGKGQSAERAAVLMENAFSALGKSDIRGKMEKAGVNVFDKSGKMRDMVDIFKDLSSVTSGMNDEQKSSFLEKLGLVDKEAKNAFALMTNDLNKFREAMDATGDATGETEKALNFSQNAIQNATELWNDLKGVGLKIGEYILPVIEIGISATSIALNSLCNLVNTVIGLFSGWFNSLLTGNPVIWGVTAAITALSAALLTNYIRANLVLVAIKSLYIWDGIVAAATWLWTTAQWALNAAFYASPVGWIALAIGLVVGAVVLCWQKFEGFRRVVLGCWEVLKSFGSSLIDSVVEPFKQILKGISGVGSALLSLIKGDFKEAAESAKQGFKDIGTGVLNTNPLAITVNAGMKTDFKGAWEKGLQNGTDSWNSSQSENKPGKTGKTPAWAESTGTAGSGNLNLFPGTPDFLNSGKEMIPGTNLPLPLKEDETTVKSGSTLSSYDELMKKLSKNKKDNKTGRSNKTVLDLNDTVQDYKETADYTAITKKLAPVKVDFAPTTRTSDKITPAVPKVLSNIPLFTENIKKVDENKQEYSPDKDKSGFLQDIMLNVRRIAAVAAIPLAVNLAAPDKAGAIPVLPANNNIQVESPAINVPISENPVVNAPNPAMAVVPSPVVNVPPVDIPTPEIPAITIPAGENAFADIPDMKLPQTDAYTVERSEKITENTETRKEIETGRIIRVDRVCDNITIHVANTDRKGTDEIRGEIIRVLDELSMYEA